MNKNNNKYRMALKWFSRFQPGKSVYKKHFIKMENDNSRSIKNCAFDNRNGKIIHFTKIVNELQQEGVKPWIIMEE